MKKETKINIFFVIVLSIMILTIIFIALDMKVNREKANFCVHNNSCYNEKEVRIYKMVNK